MFERVVSATEKAAVAVAEAMPAPGRSLPVVRFERKIRFKQCQPISIFGKNEWVAQVARDLEATCKELNGAGLAAPQVGIFFQVCLVNTKSEMLILVNPRIIHSEGKQESLEGCLSLPGCAGRVTRAKEASIKTRLFKDGEIGDEVEVFVEGKEAIVFQHEIDHLKGEFFVDRMTSIRRDIMLRKIKKSWGKLR